MNIKKHIGIIGAGAWGTAFAIHLARKGIKVLLWVYEPDLYETLKTERENRLYLPGFTLPENVDFTDNLEIIAHKSEGIVMATPSFALRKTIEPISIELVDKDILILTKGLEIDTLLRMSQVTEGLLHQTNNRVAVLSGPSFAEEVARENFTSVVVASTNRRLAYEFQRVIHTDNFRVYTSEDILGVDLGGARNNEKAIGAGIIDALKLGTNTQAAYTTRAIAEIKRLGRTLGAKETTFMGLSGIGDLILTSYGKLSRNRRFGTELATGKKASTIIQEQKQVVEGYYTTKAAYTLSKRFNIEMPITEELYKILYEDKNLKLSLNDIKKRALKEEDD